MRIRVRVTVRELPSVPTKIEMGERVFVCTGSHRPAPSVNISCQSFFVLSCFLSLPHVALIDAFASDEENHYAWMKVEERWVKGWRRDYSYVRR